MHFKSTSSFMLEMIWLKSEVVSDVALFFSFFFFAGLVCTHGGMNHKQSLVVKMIRLLLQNVILCYPDSLCLLAVAKYVAK